MDKNLEQLDYKGVFKYFSEISAIPRGSGNEKAVSDYLVGFAKQHQLEYTQDQANNVIMIKKATSGFENDPAIILQGHMDMVCEKRKDYTHDFLKDGIKLIVDGDYLHADGTTLGADDGMAVSYILAMFSDESLEHPRLEAVITTDEEVGMNGAKALDLSKLQGKYMINVDSEEEGYMECSGAGGLTGTSTLPLKRISASGKKVKISISGLHGGHSGMDIDKNRTNATKLLGRLLFELREQNITFGLINMQGGFKDNVIPREANAELLITAEDGELKDSCDSFNKSFSDIYENYRQELASSEPGLNIKVEDHGDAACDIIHPVSFEKMLFLLVNQPNGIQVMSSDISGLVESSLNLGIFHTLEDKAEFCTSVRSSKGKYKFYLSDRLNYMISFLGGDYIVRGEYPAWEYQKISPLRDHLQRLYRELYNKELQIKAIHAGLECGIIYEKLPGVDIVSIGPDLSKVHTIDEKVSISSAIRVYQFLEKIVSERIRA